MFVTELMTNMKSFNGERKIVQLKEWFNAGKRSTTKPQKDHQGVVNRNEEALW